MYNETPCNLPVTTVILKSLSLISPKDPGVNLWLITTTGPRLGRVICLSLHPVKETLRSHPLLCPALCPLFNPAERPGSGGGANWSPQGSVLTSRLLLGPMSSSLSLPVWGLGVSCWHHNKRRSGICSDAVFCWSAACRVCLFFRPVIKTQCHRCVTCRGAPLHFGHTSHSTPAATLF